jgi:hypothetical protein
VKNDIADKKTMMQLLPPDALEKIAEVFTLGADKYAEFNYLEGDGIELSRLHGSILRHMNEWAKGNDIDPEWGKKHLAHLGCCVMMMLQIEENCPQADNRSELLRK